MQEYQLLMDHSQTNRHVTVTAALPEANDKGQSVTVIWGRGKLHTAAQIRQDSHEEMQ